MSAAGAFRSLPRSEPRLRRDSKKDGGLSPGSLAMAGQGNRRRPATPRGLPSSSSGASSSLAASFPGIVVMHYLYGCKNDVLRRLAATFGSEQQLLAYVRWATLG